MHEVLGEVVKSKQFAKMKKCVEKNCPRMLEVLKQQEFLVAKLSKLMEAKTGARNLKDMIKSAKELTILTEKLAKLNTRKDALLCTFTKCADEVAETQVLQNQLTAKYAAKASKQISKL